jgi:hypothetical protein
MAEFDTQKYREHVSAHLGPIAVVQPPADHGEFALLICAYGDDVLSVVSDGVRDLLAGSPTELVCSAMVDHRRTTHEVVVAVAGQLSQAGAAVHTGQLLPVSVADTRVAGVVTATHPYADAEFDQFRDPSTGRELQLVTLIPTLPEEFGYARHAGVDALFEHWQAYETDVYDLNRLPRVS